jgi:hypothetical protein
MEKPLIKTLVPCTQLILCSENEGFLLGKFGGCSEAVSRQLVELELGVQLPSSTQEINRSY